MNEFEWLECSNPWLMLAHLNRQISDRKLRLFVCAWCRLHNWDERFDESARHAVSVAEKYADGATSEVELEATWDAIRYGIGGDVVVRESPFSLEAQFGLRLILNSVSMRVGFYGDIARSSLFDLGHMHWPEECHLLRDILGNPFRHSTIELAWLSATVSGLAQAIYAERGFDRLPILADALEDAGCNSRQLLDHFRGPGPHCLGCWALDRVLGRE